MSDFTYKLSAIRGMQNGRTFYQVSVPFRVLASMLKLDDNLDVNKRSQRLVDKGRAKKVTKYIIDNKDKGFYVIPPLVGYVDGEFSFNEVPLDGFENTGKIQISLESKFILFDGQHRAFGIREAMTSNADLASENVSIMLFGGLTLEDRKQAFHDINFTQKTPAAALCVAYNERNNFDKMVVNVFKKSHINNIIEYEKNTASGNSNKIYSLKTLKDFSLQFNGKEMHEHSEKLLSNYVTKLFDVINIPAHLLMIELENGHYQKIGYSPAKEYREQYSIPHAVMLKALGLLGKALLSNNYDTWEDDLERLGDKKIFDRTSEHWLDRCVNEREKMVSNQLAVRLTYYKLKEIVGLSLSPEERAEENKYFNSVELEHVA
jgi:DNA sulfur modification protein DndB